MYALVLNRRGNHTYSYEYTIGLLYFANRLEQLGLPFKFCFSPYEVEKDDIACFSNLVSDHTSVLNLRASRIITGGIGAHANIITAAPSVLQLSGAAINASRVIIEHGVGKVTIDPLPNDVEIPLIPQELKGNVKIIQLNCGYGCFYKKCLFCSRTTPKVVSPKLTALNICEIYRKYKCFVHLSIDGPNWKYLQKIAEELIHLQPIYGNVPWACSMRASDGANYDNLSFLADSGLYSIGVGIEYLCDDVLQTIKKGITVGDVFNVFKNATKLELYLHFCLIDFDPFVILEHKDIHHKHLQNILSRKYPRLSLSISKLLSNTDLDSALRRLRELK